jgi:calcineurin-like phosphoesterase family protein
VTIYYTADTHFRHHNILETDNRPFASMEEMETAIISNWNRHVRPRDTVWFLGDFAFGNAKAAAEILERLNGRKHLVAGNHDDKVRKLPGWESSQSYAETYDGEDFLCLHHYAQRTWRDLQRGAFQLFGHSHGWLMPQCRSIDVGIMCWNYRPVTMVEIKKRLAGLGMLERPPQQKGNARPTW